MLAEEATHSRASASPVLSVTDLHTYFDADGGVVHAVDGVSFDLYPGETFGIVGESGSGKSVTCRSLIGLLPSPPAHTQGAVTYQGRNLVGLRLSELQKIRGRHIAMIFQDPMTSLNPVMRVGDQIMESLTVHERLNRNGRKARAIELLRLVGIPLPERRMRDYPHLFSGGMRQRVLIAIALACNPKILLADEPTTALDVTIQDQILTLLLELQQKLGMSVILVSHDLGVVAETCSRVAVMYAGQIVEMTDTETLLTRPRHPYTIGLLHSLPGRGASSGSGSRYLQPIPGAPPPLVNPPQGCRFYDRCSLGEEACRSWATELLEVGGSRVGPGHAARCRRHAEVDALYD
jgi:oligopeptide/dipeptide ABC transporter ATP-binding protein